MTSQPVLAARYYVRGESARSAGVNADERFSTKKKCPVGKLGKFLWFDHNQRTVERIGLFSASYVGRELLRWLIQTLRQ
jgi:hypothetical protein